MELVGLVSVVVVPFLVKSATSYFKELGPIPMLPYRVLVVRALVALLALAGAVLQVTLGELDAVDGALVETAMLTVFNALVATWLYVSKK